MFYEKHLEKDFQPKFRIVTAFQTGHIANIAIRHHDHTVNMVTFRNGQFQEVYRLKLMPSINHLDDINNLHESQNRPLITFDGETQKIKAWYRHEDNDGKVNS